MLKKVKIIGEGALRTGTDLTLQKGKGEYVIKNGKEKIKFSFSMSNPLCFKVTFEDGRKNYYLQQIDKLEKEPNLKLAYNVNVISSFSKGIEYDKEMASPVENLAIGVDDIRLGWMKLDLGLQEGVQVQLRFDKSAPEWIILEAYFPKKGTGDS